MPLIHTTDFEFGAYVPNRDDAPNSDIIGNEPILQGFIDKYSTECLVETLGWELWSLLDAELVAGDLPAGADQIWLDLVNGVDNYRGMLKGLLVGYVYFYWLENDIVDYSSTGTQRYTPNQTENKRADPKMMMQWNQFYDQAIGTFNSGPTIIRNSFGVGVLYSGASGSNFKSMYEFLRENQSVYPTWNPKNDFKDILPYGI